MPHEGKDDVLDVFGPSYTTQSSISDEQGE